MDHKGRQQRLQDSLSAHRLDALLVTHPPNLRYLCGFTGSSGALLLTEKKAVFITDGRYTEQARAEVRTAQIVIARHGPLAAAAAWLSGHQKKGRRALSKIGIEGEHMTVAARSMLCGVLPSNVRLRQAPPLIERARMVKDNEEIESIRSAVLLGASLFDRALEVIRPGVSETKSLPKWSTRRARPGRRACRLRPSLLRAGVRRFPMAGRRRPRFPRSHSWSATSVLYSLVIVRT